MQHMSNEYACTYEFMNVKNADTHKEREIMRERRRERE